MEKGLIDLREGVTIDFELGSTFARTGCTGELLVDGFDLADMAPEPADKPKDVHEERQKESELQRARYEAAVKRRDERIAKEQASYRAQEQERRSAMTSEERWNEKLAKKLASRRRRLGKALYEALNITEGRTDG